MPEQKASALRGGIGEMLLRANCIGNRKCDECDFESECLVQRTMYSKFERKPDFITTGDSVGYVMECENYETEFSEGDCLRFSLILFGKTIVYFNQYLQAIFALGQAGVGKYKSRFQIARITNFRNEDILCGSDVYMGKYAMETICDYVRYRRKYLNKKGMGGKLIFLTPLALKSQGKFINSFEIEAILKGIARRLYMLDCFEGIEAEQLRVQDMDIPEILEKRVDFTNVKRYSNRQNMSMELHGIKGEAILSYMDEDVLDLLLAGELIHIGKNTSFGFGKYMVK